MGGKGVNQDQSSFNIDLKLSQEPSRGPPQLHPGAMDGSQPMEVGSAQHGSSEAPQSGLFTC